MGVYLSYMLVTDEKLATLQANPESVEDFIEEREEELDEAGAEDLSLDKAWHAIHFMLTGSSKETDGLLNNVIHGGISIEGSSFRGMGYPVKYLSPATVRTVNEALQVISNDNFRAKFDANAMNEADIYPDSGNWEYAKPGSEEFEEYYLHGFQIAKQAFSTAASEGKALLKLLG